MSRHSVTPRAMCFIFHQDEVLLMKAADHKDWAGRYDPVGGHIEKGENVIEGARREIREETGLEVSDIKLRGIMHVSDFFGKNVILFVVAAQADTKKVEANDEGELQWVALDKLDSLPVLEDIKPILEHIKTMDQAQLFVGTSTFDGKDELLALDITLQ